jgi:preprotein translocase subunit YajC
MKKIIYSLILFSLIASPLSYAKEIGKVANLVGTLTRIKADGTTATCKLQEIVEEGDTFVTTSGTFAQLKMIDGGEMIIRPDSKVILKQYSFDQADPKADKSEINLAKGGLRRLTGLIGKRGDKDADKLLTATATAGIRGTVYDTLSCKGDCDKLEDGTYFRVKEGEILVSSEGGELSVKAGQFGKASSINEKPTLLPKDPGLPPFNPPKSAAPVNTGPSQCAA